MNSRQPPTRVSREASHSFSAFFFSLAFTFSSFSSASTRDVSSLSLLVTLRLRHSILASSSRALSFHLSRNSSLFSHSASTPSRPASLNRPLTRTKLSCLVSFLRSFRTFSSAMSRTCFRRSRFSSFISSLWASPNKSKAVEACGWPHLSGCTMREIFLYCLRTSSRLASNGRFSFSYGLSLNAHRILLTSLSRSTSLSSPQKAFNTSSSTGSCTTGLGSEGPALSSSLC
mmetsp:Transcript_20405/g.56865  ORF Transcript_20405/g.56865 Transcript_20405/m.56865 type:complete len:230 (-) Transcript_20405:251-940(-)